MPTGLMQTLRSRSFAIGVQAVLWLLLALLITKVGGKAPVYGEADAVPLPLQSLAPIARLSSLFEPGQGAPPLATSEGSSPFFTRFFVPIPSPAPPPPTTRKIEVTYQGYYQTTDGPRNAVLKIADAFVVIPVGGMVATNFYIGDAGMQSLTLTNPVAAPTLLPLNAKKVIEVPIP
jgi:hypothetical protein